MVANQASSTLNARSGNATPRNQARRDPYVPDVARTPNAMTSMDAPNATAAAACRRGRIRGGRILEWVMKRPRSGG